MGTREVLATGPEWVQELAKDIERTANANDLACVFRTVDTDEGPVVSILMKERPAPTTQPYPIVVPTNKVA